MNNLALKRAGSAVKFAIRTIMAISVTLKAFHTLLITFFGANLETLREIKKKYLNS
jgi:hypothetical protein